MPPNPISRIRIPPLANPLIRRVTWHVRRVAGQLDRRFFLTLAQGIIGFVAIAAIIITIVEKSVTIESFFDSFNWGIATVLGQGDSAFVTSPAGRIVSWLLILFGVAATVRAFTQNRAVRSRARGDEGEAGCDQYEVGAHGGLLRVGSSKLYAPIAPRGPSRRRPSGLEGQANYDGAQP